MLDLAFDETGQGPAVLICHGLFGQKRNWGAIVKRLSGSYRLLTVDMRNHGTSPWDPAMSYSDMASDLATFITRHGGGTPMRVIGHSMGGKAAMMLALKYPKLVERLCIVDIAPAPSPGNFVDYIEALLTIDLSAISSRAQADIALKEHVEDAGIRAFLLQNLENTSDGFKWKPNLAVLRDRMMDLLDWPEIDLGQSFDGPTLFIAGGASDYIGPHHHAEIERLFPMSDVEILPGIGHWAHAEAPELFLKTLIPFLST